MIKDSGEMTEYIERRKVLDLVKTFSIDICYDEDPHFLAFAYVGTNDIKSIPAADVVSGRDFRDCRNELCLKCGAYTERHLGACDGCRWRNV